MQESVSKKGPLILDIMITVNEVEKKYFPEFPFLIQIFNIFKTKISVDFPHSTTTN